MVPFELLQKVVEIFERLQIPYLVTGAIASIAYGEPRLTNDIDIVAAIKEQHIQDLIEAFPPGEFYVSQEAVRAAIRDQGQFNILHPTSGLKVDVILKKDSPFDASRFSRVRRIQPAESYLLVSSPTHCPMITSCLRIIGGSHASFVSICRSNPFFFGIFQHRSSCREAWL